MTIQILDPLANREIKLLGGISFKPRLSGQPLSERVGSSRVRWGIVLELDLYTSPTAGQRGGTLRAG
jgi:hypothetical protein